MTEDVSRWTQRALLLFQNDTPYDTWMQHVIVLSASTSEWMVSQIPEEILLSLMALMMLGHSPSVIRTPAPELPTELVLDSKVQAVTQAILECIATFPHSTSSEIFLGLMATFWGAEELYFRIRSRERELELSVTTMRRLFGVDCGQELERMELADEAIEVIRGTLSALPPKVRYGVILDLMQTGEGGKEVWYALKKREKILAEEEEWI
ncbi:hypothetical protein EDC01DRAFT_788288 [Geopyxis carbonaria]|nr:hypothetical protein EDC01DRAFT_788288 [Geopyxis carbonaria]